MGRWAIGIEVTIVILWLGGMALHPQFSNQASQTSNSQGLSLLEAVDSADARWMGIYMDGIKIGTSYSEEVPTQDGWRLQERSYIKIRAFDQDKEITTVSMSNIDRKGKLLSFHYYLAAPPVRTDVSGQMNGNQLDIQMLSGESVSKQTFELPDGAPEMGLTFKRRIIDADPQAGEEITLPYFDPATLSSKEMKLKVIDRQAVKVDGENMYTYVIEAGYQGMISQLTLRSDGRTLKEEGSLGMTMVAESREEALTEGWGDRPPADIIALSLVPVPEPIKDARKTRKLRVKLSGGGIETLIKEAHPKERLYDDGEVRIIIPDLSKLSPPMLPVVQGEFAEYLKPTPTIQSEDIRIVQIARATVGDELKADDAAKELVDFVYNRLEKIPTVGIPSALEVLKISQGDCNEHTILFTAMARAVGLPSRIAAGIVYSDGGYGSQGFLYHAWPEVWLGEWVPVDPTFGQFPADATHIKLVEGDLEQQIALVRVVGNLDIEVLEAQ